VNYFKSCAVVLLFAAPAVAQFTDWSAPVNLGPPVNTGGFENCVSISKNGLSMYFARLAQTSYDLYVSKRASVAEPWGLPLLVPQVNHDIGHETCPALSLDEHRLYFASDRPGGCGGQDIWVSRRHDRRDDFGWEAPVNLGCDSQGYVNSSGNDFLPGLFEDDTGTVVMYFTSNRLGSLLTDIYQSHMRDDDTFGPATPIQELNSPYHDRGASIRRDGLELVFDSTRPGGKGLRDIYVSTRESLKDPWSAPVNIMLLNSPSNDGYRMSFSFDGLMLYFSSDRPGGYGNPDIYVTTRQRLHGKK
jgi:Tol biopolymer transport system component